MVTILDTVAAAVQRDNPDVAGGRIRTNVIPSAAPAASPCRGGGRRTPDPAALCRFIADVFDIDPAEVTPGLGIHAIPEWSSLGHVELMVALEERYGVTIEGPLVGRLSTVDAICRALVGPPVSGRTDPELIAPQDMVDSAPAASDSEPTIHRGLGASN